MSAVLETQVSLRSGRSLREGMATHSKTFLQKSMDREPEAAVIWVTQSRAGLKQLSVDACPSEYVKQRVECFSLGGLIRYEGENKT